MRTQSSLKCMLIRALEFSVLKFSMHCAVLWGLSASSVMRIEQYCCMWATHVSWHAAYLSHYICFSPRTYQPFGAKDDFSWWTSWGWENQTSPKVISPEYVKWWAVIEIWGLVRSTLFLLWCYNSDRILTFSTISFHLRRSCTCSAYFVSFIFFRSFLTSSSHRDLGFPAGLPVNSFHLCILYTMLVLGILFVSKPTQIIGL